MCRRVFLCKAIIPESIKENVNNTPANNWTVPQRNVSSELYGTITDIYNKSLEGVSVSAIRGSSSYNGLTDADGNYRISKVPEGAYDLIVTKEGYKNITIYGFTLIGGFSHPWNLTLSSSTGSFHGKITSPNSDFIADANVSLVGDSNSYSGITDESGNYGISGIQPGTYAISVTKPGYRNITIPSFAFGQSDYTWNANLSRDCMLYTFNSSANYVLRYGLEATVYKANLEAVLPYPQCAKYQIYPDEDGLSEASTSYVAGNRVLTWSLDNSDGDYSYVEGHAYFDMNGTGIMKVFGNNNMSISRASSSQPGYLGSETTESGKSYIDTSNYEIRKLAQQIKDDSGSDDTWVVARAIFLWLKNNTSYYIGSDTSYSRLPAEVLQSRNGKCDELAHLYISMLRSVNIPSRFVKGYLIERNPSLYISHRWAEFYDGEWVPVEVAGNFNNATLEADLNFGIQKPGYVAVYVDDGSDEAMSDMESIGGTYKDRQPTYSAYVHYDIAGFDEKYLAICQDGTRELKDRKE